MLLYLCNISGNVLKILVSVLILRVRTRKSWREEDPLVVYDDGFLDPKKANDIQIILVKSQWCSY